MLQATVSRKGRSNALLVITVIFVRHEKRELKRAERFRLGHHLVKAIGANHAAASQAFQRLALRQGVKEKLAQEYQEGQIAVPLVKVNHDGL